MSALEIAIIEDWAELVFLQPHMQTYARIAKEHGVSVTTVRRVIRRWG